MTHSPTGLTSGSTPPEPALSFPTQTRLLLLQLGARQRRGWLSQHWAWTRTQHLPSSRFPCCCLCHSGPTGRDLNRSLPPPWAFQGNFHSSDTGTDSPISALEPWVSWFLNKGKTKLQRGTDSPGRPNPAGKFPISSKNPWSTGVRDQRAAVRPPGGVQRLGLATGTVGECKGTAMLPLGRGGAHGVLMKTSGPLMPRPVSFPPWTPSPSTVPEHPGEAGPAQCLWATWPPLELCGRCRERVGHSLIWEELQGPVAR